MAISHSHTGQSPQRHQAKHSASKDLGRTEPTPASEAPNYISLAISRLRTLADPTWSMFSSLNPSQRHIAIGFVVFIFFWPLLFGLLNLPWMLTAGAALYALALGPSKFLADAKSSAREHFNVDVEEKVRDVRAAIEKSEFKGKRLLMEWSGRIWEGLQVAYKTVLLLLMAVVDYIVTLMLRLARFVNSYSTPSPKKPAPEKVSDKVE